MLGRFLLSLIFYMGSVVIMPAGYSSSLEQSSILQNIQGVNIDEINRCSFLPERLKNSLSLKRQCILSKPDISEETAFTVLQDCTGIFANIGFVLQSQFNNLRVEDMLGKQEKYITQHGMETFWLVHNFILYAANIYYSRTIPEGILDITPFVERAISEQSLPHLVHLRTDKGPVFLFIPFVEPKKVSISYLRSFAITDDKTLRRIEMLYDEKKVIHDDGLYLDLANDNGYHFSLGAYLGWQYYQMAEKTFSVENDSILHIVDLVDLIGPVLWFSIQELGNKIGGLENLARHRKQGELLFLPFPLSSKKQDEAVYAEDLFQAKQSIDFLDITIHFLLENTPVNCEDKNINAENEEKRKKILERKQNYEQRLSRLSAEYQTSQETLIATIEGKLLTLNEAEYQQRIQIEQKKIRDQLAERSKAGVMKGKKKPEQKKTRAIDEEKQEISKKLEQAIAQVRVDFLKSISDRHKDRRFVLEKFHQYLQKNNISFYEKQSGSHKVTHTEGASPVTVVEEHKGTAEFSGATIRKMLKVYGDALSHKVKMGLIQS